MSLIRFIKVRKIFCWKRDKKDPYILSPSARVWMCTWTISTRYSRATDYRCMILILKFSTAKIQIPKYSIIVRILFVQFAHLAKIFGIFEKKTLIGVRSPWVEPQLLTHFALCIYINDIGAFYLHLLEFPFVCQFYSRMTTVRAPL